MSASRQAQDCTHLQLAALQIWDYISGKLKKDLQYQAEEQFMLHDTAVLALAFSSNSDILVSGSQDGKIKVGCTMDLVEKAHCLVVLLVKRRDCTFMHSEPCCHAMPGCWAPDKCPCHAGALCPSGFVRSARKPHICRLDSVIAASHGLVFVLLCL